MLYKKHLHAIGMDKFNFDEYIKEQLEWINSISMNISKNNDNNNLDNNRVKFEDYGAKILAMLTG